MMTSSVSRRIRREAGLTLIELMIALVMGLILLAGVVTVFVANKQTYRLQDALARLQENGRFALTLLERDIRLAGADSCGDVQILINTVNDGGNPELDFGEAVTGLNNVTSRSFGGKTAKPGTDVLSVLIGGGQGAEVIQHPLPSAQLKVTAFAGLNDGDIVLVVDKDCKQGSIFQITNFQNQSGHHSEVVHNAGTGTPGNSTKDLVKTFLGGRILQWTRAIYFVADTGRSPCTGCDTIPALYRVRNGILEELVEGVEDFQVLYGRDTNRDEIVDRYDNADIVGSDWAQVRSVRFWLRLQSVDPNVLTAEQTLTYVPPEAERIASLEPGDRRWRQLYGATVGVRNRLP